MEIISENKDIFVLIRPSFTPLSRVAIKTITKPKNPDSPEVQIIDKPEPVIENPNRRKCPYCPKICADMTMLNLHIKRQHAQKLEKETYYKNEIVGIE